MSNDLLSFNKSARRSAMIYLVLAAGVISAVLALSIDPALHCKENTCPGWLRGIFGSFGALVALGALTSLVKKSEWGSRVDRNERRLIWWVGPPPRQEKSIDIDRISVVRVETKWDSHKLIIRDKDGKRVAIPETCVPAPLLDWAKAFSLEFPQVKLETD